MVGILIRSLFLQAILPPFLFLKQGAQDMEQTFVYLWFLEESENKKKAN